MEMGLCFVPTSWGELPLERFVGEGGEDVEGDMWVVSGVDGGSLFSQWGGDGVRL